MLKHKLYLCIMILKSGLRAHGDPDRAVRESCLEIRARRLVQGYRAVLHRVRATTQFISFQLSLPSSHPACNSVLLVFSLPNCQVGTECKMLSIRLSFAL